jgi:hypothetical protein
LTSFNAATNQGIFIEYTASNDFGVERRGFGKRINGVLKWTEVFTEGVENEDGENVVVSKWAHGDDTMIVGSEFGKRITERFLIREVDFEALKEKVKLGKRALLLMESSEFLKHEVCGGKSGDKVNVRR